MLTQPIQLESISFFEKDQGVWHQEPVEEPTPPTETSSQELDDEELEAFCRRSLS